MGYFIYCVNTKTSNCLLQCKTLKRQRVVHNRDEVVSFSSTAGKGSGKKVLQLKLDRTRILNITHGYRWRIKLKLYKSYFYWKKKKLYELTSRFFRVKMDFKVQKFFKKYLLIYYLSINEFLSTVKLNSQFYG